MRILLLRTFYSLEKNYFPRFIDEPLALEYLAAYIRNDHQVKIFDSLLEGFNQYRQVPNEPERIYQGAKLERLDKIIKEFKPEVIGINWFFSSQNDGVEITANHLKKNFSAIPIIVGGPQPSGDPIQILKDYPAIDMVVFGEGEITLKELLAKKLQDLPSILGITYRQTNEIIKNEPRPLIKNLDEIPFPARDLLKFKNYGRQRVYTSIYKKLKRLGLNNSKEELNRQVTAKLSTLPIIDQVYYWLHNRKKTNRNQVPAADMVTSRGCPNNCSFCAVHNVWGRSWRMRSAENVLNEIEELAKKYGIKHINFQDDNFNVSKERTIKICKGLIESKYGITISVPPGLYLPSLDEEVLTWLKKAGVNLVRISVESGNQMVLDKIIRKRIDLSQVKKVTDICRKLDIRTEGAFIFGLPGETIETMKETAKFAKNAGFDRVKRFIYQPFPNTDLYRQCIEKGYITSDYDSKRIYVTGDKCYIKTENFSPQDVLEIARDTF
ncbi:MAG: radical SAM protein [Patescibacteria group bacterium]